MATDHQKMRRLESALFNEDAKINGLHRAYHGVAEGGGFIEGAHGLARDARIALHRQITTPERRHTGGPYFDLAPSVSVADMLALLQAELARLEALPPKRPRVAGVFVEDAMSTIRADIGAAHAAMELQRAADTLKAELDRATTACAPLRQLVAACRKFTGDANSTLANMARGA